jgi:hypothetical protein
MVVDEDGVVEDACLHEMPDGTKRTRQVCFIEIYRCDQPLKRFLVAEPVSHSEHPEIHRVKEIDVVVALNVLNAGATLDVESAYL